jgi:hypothetical protein
MAGCVAMIRRLFTWRLNLYRLVVGAIVLAIVIPAWEFGVKATWVVAVGCILVVIRDRCWHACAVRPTMVTSLSAPFAAVRGGKQD